MFSELLGLIVRPALWVLRWIPHMGRMHITERGVRLSGRHIAEIGPGFYLWIPNMSLVVSDNVKRKARSLADQTLTTKDGVTVRAGAVIDFRVVNITSWLVENEDPEIGLYVEAQRLVCEWVEAHNFDEILARSSGQLTGLAEEQLGKEFGVWIRRLGFDTFAETSARDFTHQGAGLAVDDS